MQACVAAEYTVPCECRSANNREVLQKGHNGDIWWNKLIKERSLPVVFLWREKTYLEEHDFPEGPLKQEGK